jgi:hypothetical protein
MRALFVLLLASCAGMEESPLDGFDDVSSLAADQLGPPAGRSCRDVLARNPGAASGVYTIRPTAGARSVRVFCDMRTDGGGWTMVSSSNNTVDDLAEAYNANIADVSPASAMNGVWGGLNPLLAGANSDIRFVCRPTGAPRAVDLSFYDNTWYADITAGPSDDLTCFEDNNGTGASPPPARRDNLSGAALPAGDPWGAGYLEGEDSCADTGDFTVDFDDRGMDNNQIDGTDWGEDDGSLKCGTGYYAAGQAYWYILVREISPVP